MKIQRFYFLDLYNHLSSVTSGKQVVPFYESNQIARKKMKKAISSQNSSAHVVGSYENNQLDCLVSYELEETRIRITNILWIRLDHLTLHTWVATMENVAQKAGYQNIILSFALANVHLSEFLCENGYQYDEENHTFKKTITVSTGLVLGGGGARGAYQIGVWEALCELDRDFSVITGTSVGALNGMMILQDDFEAACEIWEEIDTQSVLDLPIDNQEHYSLQTLLQSVGSMTNETIKGMGVSTAPLQQLLKKYYKVQSWKKSKKQFYIVTTQVPLLKETVVSVPDAPADEVVSWLLASSTFFPVMSATNIENQFYIDGGYRNNIPVDIALNQGVTELIVVDIKGPGVTKHTSIPNHILEISLTSPWSLGNIMLFDDKRSSWNRRLGYLETMKTFDYYRGYWYTVEAKHFDRQVLAMEEEFIEFIQSFQIPSINKLVEKFKEQRNFAKKMHTLYQDRISFYNLTYQLLEENARLLDLSPLEIYSLSDLEKATFENWQKLNAAEVQPPESEMLLSLNEWIEKYVQQMAVLSEKKILVFLWHKLKEMKQDKKDHKILEGIFQLFPVKVMMGIFILWLEEKHTEGVK